MPFRAGKKMSAPISYLTEKTYRAPSFTCKSIAFLGTKGHVGAPRLE